MSKQENIQMNNESFGTRMARFRKNAGYTQRDLAKETNITQRMIAYYEKQANHPPTHQLPVLAKALNVSADQLLGIQTEQKKNNKTKDLHLWRRFSQIEKLTPKVKKQIIQLLDTFIEKEQLKKKISSQ
jgi:transcriptional regulator with XRE-family HTH domain